MLFDHPEKVEKILNSFEEVWRELLVGIGKPFMWVMKGVTVFFRNSGGWLLAGIFFSLVSLTEEHSYPPACLAAVCFVLYALRNRLR